VNFEDTCKGFLEVGKVSFACSKAFSFLVVLQVLMTVLQLVIKNSCLPHQKPSENDILFPRAMVSEC
jgi:hypothetical protein